MWISVYGDSNKFAINGKRYSQLITVLSQVDWYNFCFIAVSKQQKRFEDGKWPWEVADNILASVTVALLDLQAISKVEPLFTLS